MIHVAQRGRNLSLVRMAAGPARTGNRDRRPSERTLSVIAVVLTFASGGMDVSCFARLGNVFASVMTGNMVVFGLSLARGSLSLGLHTGAAVCGYAAGVAVATRFSPRHVSAGSQWPARVTALLLAELALLACFTAGWEAAGSQPAGGRQIVVLVVAACSMGIQSAAVVQMGLGHVSTTYLTGTLTGLVSSLVQRDGSSPGQARLRRPGVLLGLLAGATLTGLLLAHAAAIAPLPPLLAVAAAAYLTTVRAARKVTREYLRD